MTTEITILNKQVAVLAADSAVSTSEKEMMTYRQFEEKYLKNISHCNENKKKQSPAEMGKCASMAIIEAINAKKRQIM